jgi:hypothetical protein
MDANSKANGQEKGEASIESRQHHHAETQIASERVLAIAKWITGNPRATVFQYQSLTKVRQGKGVLGASD